MAKAEQGYHLAHDLRHLQDVFSAAGQVLGDGKFLTSKN
jgi:hypothetical protein